MHTYLIINTSLVAKKETNVDYDGTLCVSMFTGLGEG